MLKISLRLDVRSQEKNFKMTLIENSASNLMVEFHSFTFKNIHLIVTVEGKDGMSTNKYFFGGTL